MNKHDRLQQDIYCTYKMYYSGSRTRRDSKHTTRRSRIHLSKMRQKIERRTTDGRHEPNQPNQKTTNLFWFSFWCVCIKHEKCTHTRASVRWIDSWMYISTSFVVTFIHHFFFNHEFEWSIYIDDHTHGWLAQLKINRMQIDDTYKLRYLTIFKNTHSHTLKSLT